MKITADRNLYVATTWGACMRLAPGEVKEVGDDMGYAALQAGATEVKDTPAPAPKAAAKKKTTKKVRARDKKGHYKADDPSTPDVDEAYVQAEVKVDDEAKIL